MQNLGSENNDPAASLHLACSNNFSTVNKINYVIYILFFGQEEFGPLETVNSLQLIILFLLLKAVALNHALSE